MIVTLSGVAGSGKSSVAKALAEKLRLKHFSMGDLNREIAKEKGVTIVELAELERKDKTIDALVDARLEALGKKEDDFVIDSWMAGKFIPHAFKVFLSCDLDVRARRITKEREAESYTDIEVAKRNTIKREKANRERWIEYYGYDFLDMKNYDLVIDTSSITIPETVDIIVKELRRRHIR